MLAAGAGVGTVLAPPIGLDRAGLRLSDLC